MISATKTLTTISLESKGNEETKDNKEVEQNGTDTLLSPLNNMAMLFTMQTENI